MIPSPLSLLVAYLACNSILCQTPVCIGARAMLAGSPATPPAKQVAASIRCGASPYICTYRHCPELVYQKATLWTRLGWVCQGSLALNQNPAKTSFDGMWE